MTLAQIDHDPATVDWEERCPGLSRDLAEAVAELRFEDVPDDVVALVTRLMLDTFGVTAGAAQAPGIAALRAQLNRWESGGSATDLLGGARLSPPSAALLNGAAAHALDFDDMHDAARIHGFCVQLPAMLAAAEDLSTVSGRDFLLAMVVGAEVHARLGHTANNSLGKGWHPTMTLGTLAAALGAGKLAGQDADGLLNTLGVAHHMTAGSAQSMLDGVLSKRVGAGIAARNAVTAAGLAGGGITGPFRPLEGKAGLFRLQERGEIRPEALLDGWGVRWDTRDYSIKPFPCCRCNHTSIALAFELRSRGLVPGDVESIEIHLPQVNYQTVGAPYEVDRYSVVHAQFNAAYSVARAIADGHVDLTTYTRDAIADPDIADLARRITVHADATEAPTLMGPSKILVRTRSGGEMRAESRLTPGGPEAPMSDDEVAAKFRTCVAFGADRSGSDAPDRFVDLVLGLAEARDATRLAKDFPRPTAQGGA